MKVYELCFPKSSDRDDDIVFWIACNEEPRLTESSSFISIREMAIDVYPEDAGVDLIIGGYR